MTVPNFLASSFYYSLGSSPITDVATIITDVRTILTSTNNPVWTEPVAGTFQSPIDSAGRFMRITLTKLATTRLNVVVQDQNLLTIINRELQIPATGEVYYFTGQYHFVIEVPNGTGVADHIYCFMIDPSPYTLNAQQNYVIANAYRAAGGSIDGQGTQMDQFYMIESGVAQVRQRIRAVFNTTSTAIGLVDFQGNPQIFPCDIWGVPSGVNTWMGKPYQMYLMPNSVGAGTIKKIALDDGTLASFKVMLINPQGSSLTAVRMT